jgi:uncharacterized membrane protein YqjE
MSDLGRTEVRGTVVPPNDHLVEERSLGELMGDLSRDMSTLVRKELELARIEIKEEVSNVGKAGGILGGTALAGYMALVMISFAIAWGLAAVMPTGFAFLLVGLVYAVVAAVLYSKGRAELQKVRPVPEQTVETLKEDVQWARQQMK